MRAQVDSIKARVVAGSNVALIGPPGMGKSWTFQRLHGQLEDGGVKCYFADLQSCKSASEALRKILVTCGYSERSSDPEVLWKNLASRTWERQPCILILDEFDAVLRFPDGADFLRNLRERVQFGPGRRGPTLAVASRRPIWMIEEAVTGISTLESVFAPVHCTFMDQADIIDSWPGVFQEAISAREALLWSGGIPEVCSRLYERTRAHASRTFEDSDRTEWSRNALDYFSNLGLGDALQQHVLGPVVGRKPIETARLVSMRVIPSHWRDWGATPQNGVDEFMYLWDFAPLVDEVRHRAETMSAWGERGRAEVAGRQLLVKLLESEDWESNQHPAYALICAARERARLEGAKGPTLTDAVANFAEGELWTVVSRCGWSMTNRLTPADPLFWKATLSPLGGIGRMRGMERSSDERRFQAITGTLSAQVDWLMEQASRGYELAHPTPAATPTTPSVRVVSRKGRQGRLWVIGGGVLAALGAIAGIVQMFVELLD